MSSLQEPILNKYAFISSFKDSNLGRFLFFISLIVEKLVSYNYAVKKEAVFFFYLFVIFGLSLLNDNQRVRISITECFRFSPL